MQGHIKYSFLKEMYLIVNIAYIAWIHYRFIYFKFMPLFGVSTSTDLLSTMILKEIKYFSDTFDKKK